MNPTARLRHDIRRLWKESAGTRALSAGVAAAGCLDVSASLLFVWITKLIVDYAVAPAHHIPLFAVALLVGCLLLQLIIPAARRRFEAMAIARYNNNMRSRLLLHILQTSWSGRSGLHDGDAISRMRDDVSTLASLSCSVVPGIIAVILQLAGAFLFLALLDLRLALTIIFIMPVALAISKIYVKRMRRVTRRIRDYDSSIQTFLQESLRHRTLLSTLMATARRADGFRELLSAMTVKILKRTDISIFTNMAVSFGFMAGYCVTFLWSAYGLAAGVVSFGMMTAFLQLVAQVQRPVLDLSHRIPSFINASVALDRIDEILSLPLENYEASKPASDVPVGLRFRNVCFRYPDGEEDVIRHIDHEFRPGSITAVIGPTGSGKSTLLRIMLGLVTPSEGSAEFYTTEGDDGLISPALRHSIVYVPQGNSLVCGTIRENLQLADPEATEEEMHAALAAAVADFVFDLPEGLDTSCFEGGAGFSEGQAQRIAIARGLLKKGSLIMLDEPTSALDPDTELDFMKRFLAYVQTGATIIIITHRHAVLDYCTDVLDLQH